MESPAGNVESVHIEKYDIVVFGASGFTGQFVVDELARTIDDEHLKWAIAGRDMKKLQTVLANASERTGKDLSELPIIIADVANEGSLLSMCQQARVVVNCVGPYAFYGTPVVKACIEVGASHVDICGEPGWLEKTRLVYDSKAKEAGVYIVEACGFDCIPAEMGLLYTKKQFAGDLNAVESYVTIHSGSAGMTGNYGTWQSAVNGISKIQELKDTRRELYPSQMPRSAHPMAKRPAVFYSSDTNSWCLPFPGADKSVVFGTEYFQWMHKKRRPVQFCAYFCVPTFLRLLFMMFLGIIFFVFTRCQWGISLLERYPRLFSLGTFSHKGPTKKQMAETSFTMTFIGNGYATEIEDVEKQHTDRPDKRIVTRVTGPEPGYVATPACLVQSAFVLLKEREKLPPGGGVLTPGAAFAETSLIERLERHGLHFSTVEK